MKESFLKSRRVLLQHRPLVVGTLIGGNPLPAQWQAAQTAQVDLIEIRLDTFPKAAEAFQRAYDFGRSLIREIKNKTKLPLLLTFRSSDEGGPHASQKNIPDNRRAEILSRLLPSVDMVDVEIRHVEFARRMTVIGHIHGVDVVHSAHDFSGPGEERGLNRLSALSVTLKGDVFKVAVTPRTNDDLEKFLKWGGGLNNKNKVLIGMGAVGLVSRVVGFSFGSILTYGHLGRSAAPGQMPVRALVQSLQHVYPSR